MPETIGPHLLGRLYVPDDRDYQLGDFLDATVDPLQTALTAMLSHRYSSWFQNWSTLATRRIIAASPPPAPGPTPPPAVTDVVWADADVVLDQGDTGHCVGFGWGGWGDTLPIDDHYVNADGHAVYYEAKVIDGEPGAEDGSQVRSGATAMRNRKRLSAYAFAASIAEVRAWLAAHGPVVFGTDWDRPMFTPDAQGFVVPDGDVQGGHCYVCVGDLISEGALLFQNSWGAGWGLQGRFKIRYPDVVVLLARQGEACASVELP